MTKSSTTKVAARKARNGAKAASQVRTGKTDNTQPKSAVAAAPERQEKGRKTAAPKIAVGQLHDSYRKSAPKAVVEKTRDINRKAAREIAEQLRASRRKVAPKAVPEKTREIDRADKASDAHRRASDIATEQPHGTRPMATAQFEELREAHVPDSMRALAERNVAQTRELYQRSKNALQSALEIWGKSFGAAGQGAVTLNRKIMDIADRNINSTFDLAESLAGARNLPEALELQAAYWRALLGELQTQAEEVRALSTKVAADVAKPIKDA